MEREKSSWIPVSDCSWTQARRARSWLCPRSWCETGLLARHGATQTLPAGPCGSVPVLTGSALLSLHCWNLQLGSGPLRVLGTGPWAPQLIPGTVTADPPLQALEAVVLWMPHGTAPQSLHRFSAVGPRRSPGALDLCSADGSSGSVQWHCLSSSVSAKAQLINHLGPGIIVWITFWVHLSCSLKCVLWHHCYPEFSGLSLASD